MRGFYNFSPTNGKIAGEIFLPFKGAVLKIEIPRVFGIGSLDL